MHQFESGRRLSRAEVVKLVDTRDLKSLDFLNRASSILALGTLFSPRIRREIFIFRYDPTNPTIYQSLSIFIAK